VIVEEVSIEIDGDAPDPPVVASPAPAVMPKIARPAADAEITVEIPALGHERDTIQDVDDDAEALPPDSERPAPSSSGPPPQDPESVATESGERRKKNPRDSGIDDWHKALSEIVAPPRPKVGKGATGFGVAAKKKTKR